MFSTLPIKMNSFKDVSFESDSASNFIDYKIFITMFLIFKRKTEATRDWTVLFRVRFLSNMSFESLID